MGDILIIGIPNAATREESLPFFNVDDSIFASPFIDVAEQNFMDFTEQGKKTIILSIFMILQSSVTVLRIIYVRTA